jgi:predicted nuclease with TOPRIM domain
VCFDALVQEKEAMAGRMTKLEAELAAAKNTAIENGKQLAFLEEKADLGARYYDELKEVHAKFAAEKKILEDALWDATAPGEDEDEDTVILARPTLIHKIEELERILVDVARHGFGNAVDQLKMVNPSVEFRVEGIHFLKYVENGRIMSPRDADGDVGNSQAYTAL